MENFWSKLRRHAVHRYLQMYPDSIDKAYAHGYPVGPTDFEFTFSRMASQSLVLQSYFSREALNTLIYLLVFKNSWSELHIYLSLVIVALNFIGLSDTQSTVFAADQCLQIYKKMEKVYQIKQVNILLDEC